jgi:hypothetical protein
MRSALGPGDIQFNLRGPTFLQHIHNSFVGYRYRAHLPPREYCYQCGPPQDQNTSLPIDGVLVKET